MAIRSQKDVSAYSELVVARSPALLRTAYVVVGDRQRAQDLLQEALVKAYVTWPRLRDATKAEAYVRRTIGTTAISWRHLGSRLVPVLHLESDWHLAKAAFDTATHRALRLRLPAGYRAGTSGFTLFEWLDDDTVALTSSRDILTCRVSSGRCVVAAQASKGGKEGRFGSSSRTSPSPGDVWVLEERDGTRATRHDPGQVGLGEARPRRPRET